MDSPFKFASPSVSRARTVLVKEEAYLIEETQLDSFSVRLWRPRGQGARPAVLLLPAIWGNRVIERFAQHLVSKGFACLQFSSQGYLDRLRGQSRMKIDSLAEMIRRHVIETGQAFQWLSMQPEIDPDRIGILGISIGAIIATLFAETDGHIQAASYLLGGGNLPDIMVAPKGYVKGRLRKRIMSENGMSEAEFKHEAIRAFKPVDPLTYAGRIDPDRILMVNGRLDQVIPYRNAKQLWNALGQPDWVVLPAGHYTASFFIRYIRYRVSKHFVEHLMP